MGEVVKLSDYRPIEVKEHALSDLGCWAHRLAQGNAGDDRPCDTEPPREE
jgi:hypothetical protein